MLHIPRTGGHARGASLRGAAMKGMVALVPHNTRAGSCVGPVVCFLRDPVTRFISASQRLSMAPEDLLRAYEDDSYHGVPAQALLLRPQSWWNDRDLIDFYQVERMDQIWEQLMYRFDLPHDPLPKQGMADRNESRGRAPKIDYELMLRIEKAYESDVELWYGAADAD